jgi:hypothetical protein
MRDFLELATTVPLSEPCAQMGDPNYRMDSNLEAKALIAQIKRIHGNPPAGASIKMVPCEHDFGTYYDIIVIYDTTHEESEEWALNVEGGLPDKWDAEALEYLSNELYNFPSEEQI